MTCLDNRSCSPFKLTVTSHLLVPALMGVPVAIRARPDAFDLLTSRLYNEQHDKLAQP